jgi:hypothetical protein
LFVLAFAAQALLVGSVSAPPPPRAYDPMLEDRSHEVAPKKIVRAGAGIMVSGGVIMAIGAGVLVPLSLGIVANARAPEPENYTAVAPFEQDLYAYQLKVYRAMRIGMAGAITAGVGAVVFIVGAATWGVGKRRERRSGFALLPTRGGAHGSLTMRF